VFLRNETRAKSGFVSYVSISLCFDFDPIPRAIAKKQKMALVSQLRREYEVSILRPCGRGDSNSYLSYKKLRQRDLEFSEIFGIEATHGWLAISKDVPECAYEGEGNDPFTAWE
jgi:hypothetical protein